MIFREESEGVVKPPTPTDLAAIVDGRVERLEETILEAREVQRELLESMEHVLRKSLLHLTTQLVLCVIGLLLLLWGIWQAWPGGEA